MKEAWQRISAEPAVATGVVVASINVVAAFGAWTPTPEQLAAVTARWLPSLRCWSARPSSTSTVRRFSFAGPGRARRASRLRAKPNPCKRGAYPRGPGSPGQGHRARAGAGPRPGSAPRTGSCPGAPAHARRGGHPADDQPAAQPADDCDRLLAGTPVCYPGGGPRPGGVRPGMLWGHTQRVGITTVTRHDRAARRRMAPYRSQCRETMSGNYAAPLACLICRG